MVVPKKRCAKWRGEKNEPFAVTHEGNGAKLMAAMRMSTLMNVSDELVEKVCFEVVEMCKCNLMLLTTRGISVLNGVSHLIIICTRTLWPSVHKSRANSGSQMVLTQSDFQRYPACLVTLDGQGMLFEAFPVDYQLCTGGGGGVCVFV